MTRDLSNQEMAALMPETKVGTFANYRAMSTSPKTSFITNFCKIFELNDTWLLKGEGEPFPGAHNMGYKDVCGPEEALGSVHEMTAGYGVAAAAAQKINLDEAWGKVHRILSAGTALSVALYLNIQQFAAALDTGQELKICQEQIGGLQAQINDLRGQVDRLTASPITTTEPIAGSDKKAM